MHLVPNKLAVFMNKIKKTIDIDSYKKILLTFVLKYNVFMKKYILIPFLVIFFTSCHESLEERAEREAKEFTKKNCPMRISEYVVNDSMTYEKNSRTIHYYYSIHGKADTSALDKMKAKAELIKGVKDATGIRNYKESGFNFAYTYFSTKNKGQILLDVKITPNEYNKK